MANKNKRKMHSRNIFRTPPDYTELAIKHKEFRKVCILQLNGKVCIDYKNELALRTLTQTLLQEYFNLDVDFAPGSLVPTLPLRLNYVLWLEDLLKVLNVQDEVHGIDIGCGSSCIYSLLAARKNSWHMLALESNATNIEYASENIERNSLQQYIEIFKQQDKNIIFENYFAAQSNENTRRAFQFCLCNPPFYDSTLPQPFKGNTRNPERRAKPRNCHTGHNEELACVGGEVAFVERIIEESVIFQKEICIFTSMIGHKSSVEKILDILAEKNIENCATTEFIQGHTTRWGIAWTFRKEPILKQTPVN